MKEIYRDFGLLLLMKIERKKEREGRERKRGRKKARKKGRKRKKLFLLSYYEHKM